MLEATDRRAVDLFTIFNKTGSTKLIYAVSGRPSSMVSVFAHQFEKSRMPYFANSEPFDSIFRGDWVG